MTEPAIEAVDVVRQFCDDDVMVEAVRGVDLEVAPGEFVSIMGPSGSGKSTLLHLLGGLDRPTSGEVRLNGRALAALSRKQLARIRGEHVGFVFQQFNLVPSLSAAENIALPAVIAGRRPAHYTPRVEELLHLVGLGAKAKRPPAKLSGGEQQRVAVARALVMSPEVLLADEPTGNLDSRAGEGILAVVQSCHQAGQTIVLVTHDAKVASRAQRLLYMRDGRIAEEVRLSGTSRPADIERLVRLGDAAEA
jgi:putative ABC transport system ATP-binding protein